MKNIKYFILAIVTMTLSGHVFSATRVSNIELVKGTLVTVTADANGGAGTFDTVISKQLDIANTNSGTTLLEFDAMVRNDDPTGYSSNYALNGCFRMLVDGVGADLRYYVVQKEKWETAHVYMKSLQDLSPGTHLIEVEAGRCWSNVAPFDFVNGDSFLKIMSGF